MNSVKKVVTLKWNLVGGMLRAPSTTDVPSEFWNGHIDQRTDVVKCILPNWIQAAQDCEKYRT